MNSLEFGILYRKFNVKVGGWSDVNCEMCDIRMLRLSGVTPPSSRL